MHCRTLTICFGSGTVLGDTNSTVFTKQLIWVLCTRLLLKLCVLDLTLLFGVEITSLLKRLYTLDVYEIYENCDGHKIK